MNAALQNKAEGIPPGYGFLSEMPLLPNWYPKTA